MKRLRDKKGRFISKYANNMNMVNDSQILLSNTMTIMRDKYKVTGSKINDNK